ncbi:hypothetical protein AB0Y20_00705 [Heyndrickxia oleronia]|uniref:hypothetical protein n=1 Tax=Heyndrickxia oleronia TaxID=38875 RepID=UPI003F295373
MQKQSHQDKLLCEMNDIKEKLDKLSYYLDDLFLHIDNNKVLDEECMSIYTNLNQIAVKLDQIHI